MQNDLVRSEPLSGIEVGRESEQMCLLARLFNGFANSTRLSSLLLMAQRGEMKGGTGDELGGTRLVSEHLRCGLCG